MRSQAVIHVVGCGGVAFPVYEARMAFEACRPIPLALESSAAGVPDVLSEVFVSEDEAPRFREGSMSLMPLPSGLEGHWIPVKFEDVAGKTVADGWIIQRDGRFDFRQLTRPLERDSSFASRAISYA